MPFPRSSSPQVSSGPGRRQLSEDGRQLRRGSLGGALTGEFEVCIMLPGGLAAVELMACWPLPGICLVA